MTLLHSGITGFGYNDENEPFTMNPISDFKREVSGAMATLNYRPKSFKEAGITPNFHHGLFRAPEGSNIIILCNAFQPLIALCSEIDFGVISFISEPNIEQTLTSYTGYEVLTKEQLDAPVTDEELAALNGMEYSQYDYWKPDTLGEIIFNWWD